MNLYILQETHLALCDSCSSSRSPMWVHFKWVGDISLIHVNVVVQIFPWFKIFQTSLIFTFLCLKSITIIRDKEKQQLNWFEKF